MGDGTGSQAPIREPSAGSVADPHTIPRKGPCKLPEAGRWGGGGRGDGCAGGDAMWKPVSPGLLRRRFADGETPEIGSGDGAGAPVGAAAEVPLRRRMVASRQCWKRDTCEYGFAALCVLG